MKEFVKYTVLVSLLLMGIACGSFNRPLLPPTPFPIPTATLTPIESPTSTATVVVEPNDTPTAVPTATVPTEAVVVATSTPPPAPQKNIIDMATELGSVTIFLQAMETTGMTAKLREPGPFTVFIPTDSAFDVIPKFIRDRMLGTPDSNASQDLFNLVVPGKLTSAMLTDGLEVQPEQGSPLTFTHAGDGSITVNGVKIITADIEASNGVIHLIDALILPDNVPFGR